MKEEPGNARKKTILALCNTPFQIIVATSIKYHFYRDDDFDIIFSNHFNDNAAFAENARTLGLFRNVYAVDSCDYSYYRGEENKRPKTKPEKARDYLLRPSRVRRMFPHIRKYDIFLQHYDERFANSLFECLYRRNPKIQVFQMEEGIGSYGHILDGYARSYLRDECMSRTMRLINRLFGRANNCRFTQGAYVFFPDFVPRAFPLPVIQIPKIDVNDAEFKRSLNTIFHYTEEENRFAEPVIFFEEAYAADGRITGEEYVAILDRVAAVAGKENILVKSHPRSRITAFEDAGYKTNRAKGVPWEIIFMNNPGMQDKFLVGFACGSMISPFIYFGAKTRSVSLLRLTGFRPTEQIGAYFDYMEKNILTRYPDVFFLPETDDQLRECLTAGNLNEGSDFSQKDTRAGIALDTDRPKVSVILSVLNGEKVLGEAIESILRQTLREVELICVNDGSTDGTQAVIDRYMQSDSRVKCVIHEGNKGLFLGRCSGIHAATGEYIMFLDADDVYEPFALEELYFKIVAQGVDIYHYSIEALPEIEGETQHLSGTKSWHSPSFLERLEGRAAMNQCFAANKISRSLWSKIYRTELCRKAICHVDDSVIVYGDDAYLFFLITYFARSYVGDASGRTYYKYKYAPDLYTTDKVTKEKFRKMCKWWGTVRNKTKEFLLLEHDFDACRKAWEGLNIEVLLKPIIHIWCFRIDAEDRADCFDMICEYWESAEVLNLIRDTLSFWKWQYSKARGTKSYKLANAARNIMHFRSPKVLPSDPACRINYDFVPQLYGADPVKKDEFERMCVCWGTVRNTAKDFLAGENALDSFGASWKKLNIETLLKPILYIWCFRIQAEDRAECFEMMCRYWDKSEVVNLLRDRLAFWKWQRNKIINSKTYKIGKTVVKVPKKVKDRLCAIAKGRK